MIVLSFIGYLDFVNYLGEKNIFYFCFNVKGFLILSLVLRWEVGGGDSLGWGWKVFSRIWGG